MQATQIERPFRVKTPLGDDALLLNSFKGTERISTPFHYVLDMLAEDPNVDIKSLLMKPAVLSIKLEDQSERHIHGLFNKIKLVEFGDDGMAKYQGEIVPWFWFLNLFSNCRIFQNKTIPDIISQVFSDRGFSNYNLKLTGSYPQLEFCVQYRETDFNFVSRLMEQEGIFYFFEQSQSQHTMILADSKSNISTCPKKATARFTPATGGRMDEDTVLLMEEEHRVNTGQTYLIDYDFEKPHTKLDANVGGGGPDQAGEYYDYPGKYKTKGEGSNYANIRLEEREVPLITVRGHSNCMGFECGYKFTMTEHFRDAVNQDYIITALRQRGQNTSYLSGHTDPFEYYNDFEGIPTSVTPRPPVIARKPVIPSTQTAVVVGKKGEEIWTDQYGRIKVQFFWDREGKADEKSSCWIRVAHGWAGKNWGAIYIPRIGHEVVVSFLEGDPDRPLITGSVYNAAQEVPYPLPDEQTKSTLKSNSSKGSGGFNEFRIEDKKGSEQVFIHAQKDMDIRVENDRKEWIGEDRHLIVKRDRYEEVDFDVHVQTKQDHMEKIGRDRFLKVVGKEAVEITQSQSLKVGQAMTEEFGADHTEKTTGDYYLHAKNIVIEADIGLTINVGSNFITIDKTGVSVVGTPLINLNSGGMAIPGIPGMLVPPTEPSDPKEADNGKPGSMDQPDPAGYQQLSMQGGDITPEGAVPPPSPDSPRHDPDTEENKKKKHFIAIEMRDEEGNPVPGEPYEIILPDGTTVAKGSTDDKGKAMVRGIDPGQCRVRWPRLDQSALEQG